MAEPGPAAFMSYARFDDENDSGRLTELRERLSREVRAHTGEEFEIFQDVEGIKWGENWQERLDESLRQVTFLIPILTPSFFNSEPCRGELGQFLERERELGRNDLVLPLYYIDHPPFNDEDWRAGDELAATIASHNYADWRDLRYEPSSSPEVLRRLARLAVQIRDALARTDAPVKTRRRPASRSRSSRATASADHPSADTPSSTQVGTESEPAGAAVATTARGPSPRSEPPTRVVDRMGRGDHATITEAILASNPGDRIVVRRGLYREGLVIDKPLEIVGEGDVSEVEVEAEGAPALVLRADMARVSNLSLRQMGGYWYGVDIVQGRPEVEGCDITSRGRTCVAIRGGADPRLRRNRVHDGQEGGVIVYENSRGTLEDNDIFGNALSGVNIKQGGNPTLRRNRIHDGQAGGVLVSDNGRGTLEDNDIFGNALAGVFIKEDGNPTLRRNRIHDGHQSGVMVYENGRGTLDDNDIFGNSLAGVFIQGGGNPTLHRNRIHDGQRGGVLVYQNGLGTLEDNEILGNGHAGVGIGEGGNPTLLNNRINKNGYQAIWVYDGGGGTFESNDLRDNERGPWRVDPESESKVDRSGNTE